MLIRIASRKFCSVIVDKNASHLDASSFLSKDWSLFWFLIFKIQFANVIIAHKAPSYQRDLLAMGTCSICFSNLNAHFLSLFIFIGHHDHHHHHHHCKFYFASFSRFDLLFSSTYQAIFCVTILSVQRRRNKNPINFFLSQNTQRIVEIYFVRNFNNKKTEIVSYN